ncbi:hypothetical protein dqs_0020 [Azoarcus olearius]|uniref:DUF2357 domain-containing protein n=1 Tax=Azoarcus sp. (strain BH72) TaxID=418699 RepID=UPI0008063307|nr:DUF2357 domain-containing protein [Azoarcus olearius]ANQ83103.1 hypothetical protein dqs_0020 [Azoarcus olearius]
MLRIRPLHACEDLPWQDVLPDTVLAGLTEDMDYLLKVEEPGAAIYVDDVRLQRESATVFRWRPSFYAGRVVAEMAQGDNARQRYIFDVSPSPAKSGQDEFAAMVTEIRAFDQSLLSGLSSATMTFGREGRPGRYELDMLLTRVREHGPAFLDAVERIVRSPHRLLTVDTQVLPLSRVRRLHPTALQDRRVATIALRQSLPSESIDSFQLNSLTSIPTFDTPANRTLMALLRRFKATVGRLEEAIQRCGLESPREEQVLRLEWRLHDLGSMAKRTHKLLYGSLFREVSTTETSAAGLTQIAAQPIYSRAYRLGCRALATQVDGTDPSDLLHVPPSWGIYETWCFLRTVTCVAQITGCTPVEVRGKATAAERAFHFELPDGRRLEVLFQATFPSLKATTGRLGWSLSGERRPDIVLVLHRASGAKAMVLDAKWRSGSGNVLQAMESAHIYHDALRIGTERPCPCLLLLPGWPSVEELEKDEFIRAHGVGAVSSVRPTAAGGSRAQAHIKAWLDT